MKQEDIEKVTDIIKEIVSDASGDTYRVDYDEITDFIEDLLKKQRKAILQNVWVNMNDYWDWYGEKEFVSGEWVIKLIKS